MIEIRIIVRHPTPPPSGRISHFPSRMDGPLILIAGNSESPSLPTAARSGKKSGVKGR